MIKSILGGKSKNLFQLSDEVGVLDGGLGPNVARNFEENKWYIGLTSNNYYIPSNITEYSIKDDLIYFKRDNVNSNGYGLARAIKCEPNIIYTLSFEPIYGAEYYAINIGYFDKDGNLISTNNIAGTSKTITTPNNCNWLVLVFNFYDIYGSGKGELYFGYIQLELGSTATEYVPYELTSYKSIMKVSDVCQLVDKSKFPDTLTKNGITLTNNTDGSLTLNGTPETGSYSQFLCNMNTVVGHKYALIGIEGGTDSSGLYLYRLRIFNLNPSDFGNPNITTATSNICSMYIQVMPNITVNNINCKPQLFDLTEMFRAGNEPKTVAEFKAKFPNDYYPYSPSCFVTSFDERMPCKTKNLFDKSNADVILREYYFTLNQGAGSNFYVMTVKPGTTYTVTYERFIMSTDTLAGNVLELSIQTGTHYKDGTQLLFILGSGERGVWVKRSKQFTVPSDINQVTFSGLKDRFLYHNFMVQEGTTATDYVPYGYV